MKRVSILLTLFALSVGIAYAGGNTTHQNFDEMYKAGTLVVNTTTATGTTNFVTYTYSGGTKCRFYADGSITDGKIALQMYDSGAKVVTTQVEALDSLTVHYYAPAARLIKVSVSVDSVSWSAQAAVQEVPGMKTYKMPSAGNYFLMIERLASNDFYLGGIDYTMTPPCNCLRVVSE